MTSNGPVWTFAELMKIGNCTREYLEEVLIRVFLRTGGIAYVRIAINLDLPFQDDDLISFDRDYIEQFKEDYRRKGGDLWS